MDTGDPSKGKENVWDYPRPAVLEPTSKRLQVVFHGVMVANTTRGFRALETSHPPTYYVPEADVEAEYLESVKHTSFCEWKGRASYFDLVVEGKRAEAAVWTYRKPSRSFAPIEGCYAFYARLMDACYVDGERAEPQPGGFYAGWVTSDLIGPFKGAPGTMHW